MFHRSCDGDWYCCWPVKVIAARDFVLLIGLVEAQSLVFVFITVSKIEGEVQVKKYRLAQKYFLHKFVGNESP